MNAEERREEFATCSTMAKAIEIVNEKKVGHNNYSFYTCLGCE